MLQVGEIEILLRKWSLVLLRSCEPQRGALIATLCDFIREPRDRMWLFFKTGFPCIFVIAPETGHA